MKNSMQNITAVSKSGYSYIKEDHVWEFMLKSKWKNEENLALCEMVNDILHTDNKKIDTYLKSKITDERSQYFEKNNIEII